MARYTGPVCRLCRRERMKLFLKGDRCFKEKCAIERRGYPPGQHGQRRGRRTVGYGLQLREKQKVKRIYGVLERQFRLYFQQADRRKGITGENLLQMLERRLDNVVFRLGFAPSRSAGRQLVRHRHFKVNGRTVDIPSYVVKAGDEITVREKSRELLVVASSLEARKGQGVPDWMELNTERLAGRVLHIPTRASIPVPINEQLIVELYSK